MFDFFLLQANPCFGSDCPPTMATASEYIQFIAWLCDWSINIGTTTYPAIWGIMILSRIFSAL